MNEDKSGENISDPRLVKYMYRKELEKRIQTLSLNALEKLLDDMDEYEKI